MALFKRGKLGTPDLSTVLLEGEEMIERVGRTHRDNWGLGHADSWDLDQTTGLLRWTFPDKVVTARAQILGSHNPAAESWLWAWANKGILSSLREDAERVLAWAEANGHTSLTKPTINANEETAATLAAVAFRVTSATGFYTGPAGATNVFMTFGPVTITTADGTSTTFTINAGC